MGLLNFSNKVLLREGESAILFPLGIRAVGEILGKIDSQGVSLLSTLYVKSIDPGATVTVEYYDFTTGSDVGEATLVGSHTMPAVGSSDKIVVANIHNKPFVKAIVAGGDVEFSVYVSAYSSKGDAALVKDGGSYIEGVDFATAIAGLDRAGLQFKILSLDDNGNLLTSARQDAGAFTTYKSDVEVVLTSDVTYDLLHEKLGEGLFVGATFVSDGNDVEFVVEIDGHKVFDFSGSFLTEVVNKDSDFEASAGFGVSNDGKRLFFRPQQPFAYNTSLRFLARTAGRKVKYQLYTYMSY